MGLTTESRPRYRWRTALRGNLPSGMMWIAPKGDKDCGDHEWYRSDETTDRCYHCTVGQRPHEPMLPTARDIELLERAAADGNQAAATALRSALVEGERYLAAHTPRVSG